MVHGVLLVSFKNQEEAMQQFIGTVRFLSLVELLNIMIISKRKYGIYQLEFAILLLSRRSVTCLDGVTVAWYESYRMTRTPLYTRHLDAHKLIESNHLIILKRQSIGQNYMGGVRPYSLLFLIHSFPQNKFTDEGFSTVVIMVRLC